MGAAREGSKCRNERRGGFCGGVRVGGVSEPGWIQSWTPLLIWKGRRQEVQKQEGLEKDERREEGVPGL